MREIQLSGATFKVALVDDEDYPVLARFNWTYTKPKDIEYAVTNFNGQTIRMHQLIVPHYPTVDHMDFNGLNNQKSNLRGADYFQQMSNRRKFNGDYSSEYKGVNKVSNGTYKDLFRSRISVRGKRITLGHFGTAEEAALAYNEAAIKYFGEFVYLNKIETNIS